MEGFVANFVILYFTSKLSISYEEGTLWIWFCCIVYLFCLFQPVGGCLWHHFCHWVLQLGFLVFWRGWVAILTMRFSVHFKYKWGCLKKQYPKKKKKKMKFDLKRLYFEKVLFENVLSNRQVYWVKKYNFIWRILMIIYKKKLLFYFL